jgi:hypothetical protein
MDWNSCRKPTAFAAALAAVLALPAPAAAEPGIAVELNKLEPRKDACRAYLVLKNGTGSAFQELKLDLVMFDADGVVGRRVAVQGAPLGAGKTSLKVFDIDGIPCPGIGRILLNDVMACRDASGPRDDCTGLVTTSSRAAAPLIK